MITGVLTTSLSYKKGIAVGGKKVEAAARRSSS